MISARSWCRPCLRKYRKLCTERRMGNLGKPSAGCRHTWVRGIAGVLVCLFSSNCRPMAGDGEPKLSWRALPPLFFILTWFWLVSTGLFLQCFLMRWDRSELSGLEPHRIEETGHSLPFSIFPEGESTLFFPGSKLCQLSERNFIQVADDMILLWNIHSKCLLKNLKHPFLCILKCGF